jgi:hypothetical protein
VCGNKAKEKAPKFGMPAVTLTNIYNNIEFVEH